MSVCFLSLWQTLICIPILSLQHTTMRGRRWSLGCTCFLPAGGLWRRRMALPAVAGDHALRLLACALIPWGHLHAAHTRSGACPAHCTHQHVHEHPEGKHPELSHCSA